MKYEIGEVFEPGQVWMTPRGCLWKVIDYYYHKGEKQVLLRKGVVGEGTRRYRPWDAVKNWVIYIHVDGTRSPAYKNYEG